MAHNYQNLSFITNIPINNLTDPVFNRMNVEVNPMKIPCIACQSIFQLDNSVVKPTGTLVKCSKCEFIFIVHPPDFDGQPITQNTNIDQSILFDLFNMQHVRKTKVAIDEISDELDDYEVESLMSIEDLAEEEADAEDEEVKYADLPDLSEYENMINWGDDKNPGEKPSN